MRWRFADRIDAFEPWKMIRGRKGISLEEYSLLERFERPGVMPETLVLESCIHLARWLVAASSDWRASCLIKRIEEFSYFSEAAMGDQLQIEAALTARTDELFAVECAAKAGDRRVARGKLDLELIPIEQVQDPESLKLMWRELYAKA